MINVQISQNSVSLAKEMSAGLFSLLQTTCNEHNQVSVYMYICQIILHPASMSIDLATIHAVSRCYRACPVSQENLSPGNCVAATVFSSGNYAAHN